MFMFSHRFLQNTRLLVCSLSFVVVFSVDLIGQTAGDYRSVASGDWNNASTWEFYNGSAWVALGTISTDNNNLNSDPGWTNVNITGTIPWTWGAASGFGSTSGGMSYTNPITTASSGTWYYKSVNLVAGVSYSLTFDYKTTNLTDANSRILFAISPNIPTASTVWTGATSLYDATQATNGAWVPNTGTATFTPSASGIYYFGFRSAYLSAPAAITTSVDNIVLTGSAGIPSSSSGNINIRNGHAVDVNNNITIDQTTIDAGGTLELKAGTITLIDGAGTDLQVNGTYRRSASTSISINPLAAITVGNGGIYDHNFSGGSIPAATWADGSLLLLSNTSNAGGLNQSFYDVKVTGGTTTLSPDATNRTMIVRNDMRIEGGAFWMKGGANGGVHILTIQGNFFHSGGVYGFNFNNESQSEVRIEIGKDWIISGTATWAGDIASSSPSGTTSCNSGAYFIGNGVQTFSTILAHNGGDLRNRFYVASTVTGLHEKYLGTVQQNTINGTGGVCLVTTIAGFSPWPTSGNLLKTFTINNPAGVLLRDNRNIKDTLYRTIGSITADPDATVEVISYSPGATLEYNGTTNIDTESMEFPNANGPTNLNINNAGSVTLHESRSLNGILIFSKDNGLLNTTACKNNETTTGTAILTLNSTASVTGASDKRFVNGVLTKIGNTAFEFPIGEKQGSVLKYGPARITAPSNVTDQYTACYVGSNPGSATPAYEPLARDITLNNPPTTDYKVSTCEYWHVNSSSASTNVLLSLSWAYGRSCKFSTAADLVIANWLSASSQWTNRLNTCGTVTCPDPNPSTQRSGWVQSPVPLSQTSPNIRTFTLAHPNLATATLNESAITLRAIRRNNADQLDWTLTRACINATVSIERSTDAFSFNNILQFPVRDLESCQTNMQYAHHGKQTAMASFYRLKAILTNGQTIYSNTVRLESRMSSLQIFPIPTADQIRLSWTTQRIKELTICNQLGQIIYSDKNIQTNPYPVSLAPWRSGVYYLRLIYDNGETENHKIIRQ